MIRITKSFTGYPGGKKRVFAVGDQPDDLEAEYSKMLVNKDLAEKTKPSRKGKINAAK